MTTMIDDHLVDIQRLCRDFGVQRLDVFGSAAGAGFDPQRSDVDLLVDFGTGGQADLFTRYFGLKDSLEQLFGRPVDLVMSGAPRNPHFVESMNRSRRPLYARPIVEVA